MERRKEDDPRLARASAIKERSGQELRRYPNVTGIGVGYREVGGRVTDEISVRVYVSKKLPKTALAAADVLPREIDGIHVDVIEAKFYAHDDPADHRIRHSVIHGGLSVGNSILGGSGTIACMVFDQIRGQPMILSNWHVLCGRDDCEVGERITQPGTGGGDPGADRDIVARLTRWQLDEHVDCAVALLTGHRFCTDELFHLGRVDPRPLGPSLGLAVRKSGRTTGVTSGQITDVSADVEVDYGSIGILDFEDQLVIKNGSSVSRSGDSGSLWVSEDMRPVGLNFAGPRSGTHAIANPIQYVIDALRIDFGPGMSLQDFVAHAANAAE